MVKIYSTSWCPSCVYAKRLLEENNIEFKEVNIEEEEISREQLLEITGKVKYIDTLKNINLQSNKILFYRDLKKIYSFNNTLSVISS